MIERVARCLKIVGWTTSQRSESQFRSRRHLHSAFWSHGAGNINLPAWWIFLLQTLDHGNNERKQKKGNGEAFGIAVGIQDIFLEFLYPAQTMALIRRLRRATLAHHDAAYDTRRRSRRFTTIAEDFITGSEPGAQPHKVVTAPNTATIQCENASGKAFKEMLEVDDHVDMEKLWKSYQDFLETSDALAPNELNKLLQTLQGSTQNVDRERSVALFETIPVGRRRAIHYSCAISASLALNDVKTALAISHEARSRISRSIGISEILCYAIEKEHWATLIGIWNVFWDQKAVNYISHKLRSALDTLPLDLSIDRAASAAGYATSLAEGTPALAKKERGSELKRRDAATTARDFASKMIRHCFKSQDPSFDVGKHWNLINRAKKLDPSNVKILRLALKQLLSIDNHERTDRALNLYKVLHNHSNFSPNRQLLLSIITRKSISEKNASEISPILRDWGKLFGRLPVDIALKIAHILASGGLIDELRDLFEDLCSNGEIPKNRGLYHSLLHAYNRRADVKGVVRTFEEVRDKYGFMPGIRAWKYVITTFIQVGDADGTLAWFYKFRESGVRSDHDLYESLMSMYSRRGDRDIVEELYQQSKIEGIVASTPMLHALLLANIKDNHFAEAERTVLKTSQMKLDEPVTFLWNILLNAYAVRREVIKVLQLHRIMKNAGIASDSMTYAALMTSLAIRKFPRGADAILTRFMPRNNIKPTTLHYAIVMGAYLATRQYPKVFDLHERMKVENIAPNADTQNVLVRAAASEDMVRQDQTMRASGTELERAEQILEQTVAELNPRELAAYGHCKPVGSKTVTDGYSSTYFEYLIYLYGTNAAFSKVTELYEKFIAANKSTNVDVEASPPMRMLSALMAAHNRAGNHEEVDRCWYLCLSKAQQLACRAKADISQPGWVLHARRFIINLPLRQFMVSHGSRDRVEDVIDTVNHIREAGYMPNAPNWNQYVQILARSPIFAHQLLAFQVCEDELLHAWLGWGAMGDPYYSLKRLYKINEYTLWLQQRRLPAYLTLVLLANIIMRAKRGEADVPALGLLARSAPRTVDAVTNMPRVNDGPQTMILREG